MQVWLLLLLLLQGCLAQWTARVWRTPQDSWLQDTWHVVWEWPPENPPHTHTVIEWAGCRHALPLWWTAVGHCPLYAPDASDQTWQWHLHWFTPHEDGVLLWETGAGTWHTRGWYTAAGVVLETSLGQNTTLPLATHTTMLSLELRRTRDTLSVVHLHAWGHTVTVPWSGPRSLPSFCRLGDGPAVLQAASRPQPPNTWRGAELLAWSREPWKCAWHSIQRPLPATEGPWELRSHAAHWQSTASELVRCTNQPLDVMRVNRTIRVGHQGVSGLVWEQEWHLRLDSTATLELSATPDQRRHTLLPQPTLEAVPPSSPP